MRRVNAFFHALKTAKRCGSCRTVRYKKATDSQRTLEAETIVYDGAQNASYAYGARPLVHGTTEQGTFAVIADKVSADNEGNKITLDGKVQGWMVSPQRFYYAASQRTNRKSI